MEVTETHINYIVVDRTVTSEPALRSTKRGLHSKKPEHRKPSMKYLLESCILHCCLLSLQTERHAEAATITDVSSPKDWGCEDVGEKKKASSFVCWLCQSNTAILPCSLNELSILLDKTDDKAQADWAMGLDLSIQREGICWSVRETEDMASPANLLLGKGISPFVLSLSSTWKQSLLTAFSLLHEKANQVIDMATVQMFQWIVDTSLGLERKH